nr:beta-1,3-galactosyltransferase 9-like [Procambarus clarkii]
MATLRMGALLRHLTRWRKVTLMLTMLALVLVYRLLFPPSVPHHAQKFRLVDLRGTLGPGWDAEAEGPDNATQSFIFKPTVLSNVRYLINEPLLCSAGVDIINVIPIAPGNMETRSVIREAWGAVMHSHFTTMRTVFAVGVSISGPINKHILEESRQYQDLIQLDFTDTYENLPLKIMAMFYWRKDYCPEARWYLLSKPDVFINPFALKRYLASCHTDIVCAEERKICSTPDGQAHGSEYHTNDCHSQCIGDAYVLSSRLSSLLISAPSNDTYPRVLQYLSNYERLDIIPNSAKVSLKSAVQAVFPTRLTKGKILIEKLWHMILAYNNMTLINLFELEGSM